MNSASKSIQPIQLIRQDKAFFSLLATLMLALFWTVIDVFINVNFSQTKVWYRFVETNSGAYDRDSWSYGYNWALLFILITSLHLALAVKLQKANYRELALLMLGLGTLLLIVGSFYFNLIGKLVS